MTLTVGCYRLRFADGSVGLARLSGREANPDGVFWHGEVYFPEGLRRAMRWREEVLTRAWTPDWVTPADPDDWLLVTLLGDAGATWEDNDA